MHYIFELECPRCRAERMTCGTKEQLPPVMNCGECLVDLAAVTEFTIVRVHVVAGQGGIDMLHYINDQRSKAL